MRQKLMWREADSRPMIGVRREEQENRMKANALRRMRLTCTAWVLMVMSMHSVAPGEMPDYSELKQAFQNPDHAQWGEVPLWWWEGAPMDKERVTWQLETLAAKGVKSVCPIQRSPGRCDPQSFSPEWWDMLAYVSGECQRLGMTLWAYDQVGYGHYGWLEKAAAQVQDPRTRRIDMQIAEGAPGKAIRLELPEGELIAARAYPLENGLASDARSMDIADSIADDVLEWMPPAGPWRVAVSVAVPYQSFYLSDTSAEAFIDMFYGKIERTVGADMMGRTFAGVFQDEHPPTPRDIYTQRLADLFQTMRGYPIGRAIPALHFDVGPLTPKYRTDFFDVYLALDEACYWKRVYDWTAERGLLTSYDNWGRRNINRQSQGYIDYYRTQRWFSAPGYDDAGRNTLDKRNYYDTKIASSIARLYRRPRVWNEAFHSSGWGRSPGETIEWLSSGFAWGANLYDEHGLYYSTNASTWEHAAPDPHWRQGYWPYYGHLSDWVARVSHLNSQGVHVVDVAVHYPVVSLLAGEPPQQRARDYNHYMRLSRAIYDAAIDNDIIDDDSILGGDIRDGALHVAGNAYEALVFSAETTVRRAVLDRALELVESGGVALFHGALPTATTEGGRGDPELATVFQSLLGAAPQEIAADRRVTKEFTGGGFCAWVPGDIETVPKLIGEHIERDLVLESDGRIFMNHRRAAGVDIYLVQNIETQPNNMKARFRVDGVPELWDPFTGRGSPVDAFKREHGVTTVEQRLEGNTAWFLVFRAGDMQEATHRNQQQPTTKKLTGDWAFSVIPTRGNVWGEFRWPPSDAFLGPEVRTLRYREEETASGDPLQWHQPGFADDDWDIQHCSTGPYWLCASGLPNDTDVPKAVLAGPSDIETGRFLPVDGKEIPWKPVEFSKSVGLMKAAPWGGHSGYPDGHVDKNFIHLPEGRKLLFTRLRSPKKQRLGLCVKLGNKSARLWVQGLEQPFEDAVGNLPLEKGVNDVLLELPDGGHGMLYVQATPPSVNSMADAARGSVKPDLDRANWIWVGDVGACYVRRDFTLEEVPVEARLTVTAFSGYRLFVNGEKLEEEIGPWARWTHPETFNIAPYLHKGKNVIAVWGQLFHGQNVNQGMVDQRGIALAMKARDADGAERSIVTDGNWRGATEDQDGWESPGFDDAAWARASVRGKMGEQPWGKAPLDNVGPETVPRRPLSIHLESPYLTCFDEVPDIAYDVKPDPARRTGWFRFEAPPGLAKLHLHTNTHVRGWVDGVSVEVNDGIATVANPPTGVSTVALRVDMRPGEYAGAVFSQPIALALEGGHIQPGAWEDYAMPTYSGIGVYRKTVSFTKTELQNRTVLDLGEVQVAAEVFVNGKPAGVRLAQPFKFDISQQIREGENDLEVRVANTVAPHYTSIPALHIGPTKSGLIGPVQLLQERP